MGILRSLGHDFEEGHRNLAFAIVLFHSEDDSR